MLATSAEDSEAGTNCHPLQRDGPVGATRKIQIVSDVNRGEPARLVQLVEQTHNHFSCPVIEAAGGLVGQEHAGVAGEGSGQNHALLFAA